MGLSNDLISQFVEITKQDKDNQNGATVYGTIKKLNGQDYVQIDGSELMTPIKSTTYVSDGERVTVMIKNHQAIVTGNITSPAARQADVDTTVNQKIAEFDIIVTDQIEAQYGKFEQLVTDNITAVNGEIENLKTENLEVKDTLIAQNGEIENLKTKKLDAETANITFATIESLKATDIEVNNIKGNFAEFSQITTDNITAVNGEIENLKAEKLNVTDADIKYANIDFANIGMAAVEELFVKSGIIKDIVVGDQHITGELVGVTIKGDLIEGNTIIAEKLVVKGSDGLYYKLNTDGMKVEAQQTEYNSLNGSIITAKSITASKVMVDDLVAFDATIGGFKITDNAIYSGVKTSVNNTTTGVYLDNTGQIAFGDSNNYIKFFKDVDNQWKLMISASSMKMSASNKTVEEAISDINEQVQGTVKLVETYYAISDSYTVPPTTGWSKNTPTWVNGKYIWSKTKTTYIDGSSSESNPACITGAKGESGTSGSAGKGIKNITNYYLATSTNSGVTISTSGWTTTMQNMTSTNKYLWNYETITYTDDSITKTNPVIIGVYGDKGQNGAAGEDGVGIVSITEKYAVSSSNSTAPTTWYDTVQTMTSTNRYLWNYEIVKYTNNTTSETAKRVIGIYGDKGDKGETGVGISSVDIEYYLSTSSTAQSGGSWSTTAPTWVDGKYMWSRTKTVTTAGKTTYSNPVCITGGKGSTGATGATGKGVSSITEEYYLSTSKTTQSGGSWVTTPPTWSSGKYMWTRSKIVYTNPASTVYTAPVCDSSWEAVNDLEEKVQTNYTTKSELQQSESGIKADVSQSLKSYISKTEFDIEAGKIEAKFSASGGYNIVKNGGFKNSSSGWSEGAHNPNGTSRSFYILSDSNEWVLDGTYSLCMRSTNNTSGEFRVDSQKFKVKRNTTYTLSYLVAAHRVTEMGHYIRGNEWDIIDSRVYCPGTGGKNRDNWTRIVNTFNTGDNYQISINFIHFKTGSDAYSWITDVIINEGEVALAWSPHPSEIYEGSTLIDASGVTVKNGAIKVQNKSGQTVLSGDTNGNLVVGGGSATGSIFVKDSSGATIGTLDKNGLTLSDTAINITSKFRVGESNAQQVVFNGATINFQSKTDSSSTTMTTKGSIGIDTSGLGVTGYTFFYDGANMYEDLCLNSSLSFKNMTILNGSDTWLRTYGDTGWYSQTYGGGWYMRDTGWIRAYNNKGVYTGGNIESGSDMRCSNKLYFTAGEMGYYAYAQWYNNKACIRMPNVATWDMEVDGNATVRGGVMYLGGSSNASWVGFYDTTGNRKCYVGKGSTTVDSLYLSADSDKYVLTIGHLCPSGHRMYWLGTNSPAQQWKGLCAEGGTVGASDIRSKENIERLDGTMVTYDEVNEEIKEYQLFNLRTANYRATTSDYYEFIRDRFKPSYYNYKLSEVLNEETGDYTINPIDEYNMLKNVGFIAQDYDLETDKVAREFIFTNEDGELSYNHMSYVTVGMIALQEATRKIENLENKNKELEERLKILEDLILSK